MKDRIVKRVGELLPELVEDIKRICGMDSRQDTAVPGHPFGERVTDCLNKALEIAKGLGFETENVGNQIGIASWGPDTEDYIVCGASGCGGCEGCVENGSFCVHGKGWGFVCQGRAG